MKLQITLKAQLKKLISATKICKVCFKDIDFGTDLYICDKCFNELDCIYEESKIKNISVLCIYRYDKTFANLLYRFKGCFDYELRDVFLSRQKSYLKIKYFNYILIPIPSWKEDDDTRGFNHVEEIFKSLKLPIVKCLRKKEKFKQSSLMKIERQNIKRKLEIVNGDIINNKKILIIDDVMTTGSTIKAAIDLLSKHNPKDIKILILSRKCRKNKK